MRFLIFLQPYAILIIPLVFMGSSLLGSVRFIFSPETEKTMYFYNVISLFHAHYFVCSLWNLIYWAAPIIIYCTSRSVVSSWYWSGLASCQTHSLRRNEVVLHRYKCEFCHCIRKNMWRSSIWAWRLYDTAYNTEQYLIIVKQILFYIFFCQFWSLLNTSSVQLSYFAYKLVSKGKPRKCRFVALITKFFQGW